MKNKQLLAVLLVVVIALLAVACGSDEDDPTPVLTQATSNPIATTIVVSPTVAPTTAPIPTVVLTATPTATLTPDVAATPTSTVAPTTTPIPTMTATPTVAPTTTPTPTATNTPAPTPTAVPTMTPIPTATATPAPTATPTPDGIARAGPDKDAEKGAPVTLNGSASSDPDDDPLRFTWTQIFGPDVTDGVGFLRGATPLFTAPDEVSTVVLALRVNDGHGDSRSDLVQINVMEHTDTAFFVDGDNGSDDTGDGSRESPYATISWAINSIQGPNYDLYVVTRTNSASYVETQTLHPQTTISVYGGYDSGWVRDVVNNKTKLSGASLAVQFGPSNEDAWFSGFEVTAADASEPAQDAVGLLAKAGTATLFTLKTI